jgi:hypothetical protein
MKKGCDSHLIYISKKLTLNIMGGGWRKTINKNDEGLLDDEIEDSHRLIVQALGGRPRLYYKRKGDCRRQWAERATLGKIDSG